DHERILPWLEKCFERFPGLTDRGIKRIVNGAITYTPDGHPLVGPAPGQRNSWLACGATVGIAWGPGLGRALAQWMVHGTSEISMRGFDPRRFGPWVDEEHAYQRARENYMTRLSLTWPQDQYQSCRGIRLSGVHQRTEVLGAVYEDAGGWERPRVYGPQWDNLEPRAWRRGPSWEAALVEARAVHAGVGLGDFSAFAKFEISGPDAEAWLNRLCANRMPRSDGGTCLTLLLNECGTIEGEATIARLGADRFWFITGAPSERRVWDWISIHQRGSEDVTLRNCSDEYGILTIAGPLSREVLGAFCASSLANADFGWLKARETTIAGVPTLALRLSFSGVLAWELHARNSDLATLWDALWESGKAHRMVAFGSKALDMMRMEKAYRGGHELANDASPVHTDQMRFVKLDKAFVGRDALVARAARGETSAIAYLALDSADTDVLGGEPVFFDGSKVGSVSSGATGPVTGKCLAFAFVKPHAARPGTALEVMIFGRKVPALVLDGPVLDPDNLLLRADVCAVVSV
ncbi:MAG: FAD-dependent oxidoreductase, partial [Burkholderiaceae bacterium]